MKNKKLKLKIILIIFLVSFILNFLWENIHSPLYAGNTIGIDNYFLLMVYASFVDAFFILLVFLFIGLINKKINWILSKKNLILFAGLLIVISAIIEIRAIKIGRWVYLEDMPTILGIGISPLIQLALTGLLSLISIRRKIFLEE